jgi:hypothetical protein
MTMMYVAKPLLNENSKTVLEFVFSLFIHLFIYSLCI